MRALADRVGNELESAIKRAGFALAFSFAGDEEGYSRPLD
jgi:hypothetical protein